MSESLPLLPISPSISVDHVEQITVDKIASDVPETSSVALKCVFLKNLFSV